MTTATTIHPWHGKALRNHTCILFAAAVLLGASAPARLAQRTAPPPPPDVNPADSDEPTEVQPPTPRLHPIQITDAVQDPATRWNEEDCSHL